MDLAALLFPVNEAFRRFATGRGRAADAKRLAAALKVLEAAGSGLADDKGESRSRSVMESGTVNRNGQELVEKGTAKSTSHRFATIWRMRCSKCGNEYGSNSCDAHIRRCPRCSDGKPSEPL